MDAEEVGRGLLTQPGEGWGGGVKGLSGGDIKGKT